MLKSHLNKVRRLHFASTHGSQCVINSPSFPFCPIKLHCLLTLKVRTMKVNVADLVFTIARVAYKGNKFSCKLTQLLVQIHLIMWKRKEIGQTNKLSTLFHIP